MKRFRINLLLYVVAASALVFSACKDDKDPDTLSVSPEILTFAAFNPAAQDVTVNTNVTDWTATPSASWITATKGDGKLTVTVEKYDVTTGNRTGTITVKAGNAEEKTVAVTQTAMPIYTLSINPTSLTFYEDETGTKIVTVTANADWEYTGGAEWMSLEKSGNQLRVTVAKLNYGDKERTATIAISVGNAAPENVQVTQLVSDPIVYDGAELVYYGNDQGTGTGLFMLYLFDTANDDENAPYVRIQGYGTHAHFSEFKMDEGTWNLATEETWGDVKTFVEGGLNGTNLVGSIVLDKAGNQIMITGGTFDVAWSENDTYIITTNFTGVNVTTGAEIHQIQYRFIGAIDFYDYSNDLFLEDIAESNYTATGTPQLSFDGGDADASEWEGLVIPNSDDYGQYIAITNFADVGITIYADFIDGKLILDTQYPVWENASYAGYLETLLYYNGIFYYITDFWDNSIQYDKETQTIDFSKSFTFSDIGLQNFVVGIYAYNKISDEGEGWLTNIYPDIKLELTPVAPAPKSSAKPGIKNKGIFNAPNQHVNKKAISFDKLQLIPIDGKKMERLKVEGAGKHVDRKSLQTRTK